MRVHVDHRTAYSYDTPATGVVQLLRLTPTASDAQTVVEWRIDIDADGALIPFTDPFGNACHMFYGDGAVSRLTIHAHGEVDTTDTAGVAMGLAEPLPPLVYLRATPLTQVDDGVARLARAARGEGGGELNILHALMRRVHETVAFTPAATVVATTAAQALSRGQGVCQDHAHIFIAAARALGFPARYVSGHFARDDGRDLQAAGHAWAEAHVDGLGWVGFDAANGIAPTGAHVRVAVALDYLGAAPIRGARRGGGTERMAVAVRATGQRRRQSQSQSQRQG